MSKKYIVIVAVLLILILAGGGYFLWKAQTPKPAAEVATTVTPTPVESEQSANPYDNTNPFSNMKINPFE